MILDIFKSSQERIRIVIEKKLKKDIAETIFKNEIKNLVNLTNTELQQYKNNLLLSYSNAFYKYATISYDEKNNSLKLYFKRIKQPHIRVLVYVEIDLKDKLTNIKTKLDKIKSQIKVDLIKYKAFEADLKALGVTLSYDDSINR